MITFSILFRERAGFVKIKARSMRKAVSMAKAMGADRVFQGGYGWDSGWLK
jgi:hypothetical protein